MTFELDTPSTLSTREYEERKTVLQIELLKWQNHVRQQGHQHIIIFEGRDAAGKGGTIKRFTEHLNPRGARIVALSKPTLQEQAQWYWQRYIREFPQAGEIVFFDRSWYNRAGVEPVMGFCTQEQHHEFLEDCPQLERIWVRSGINITKFWFSVSKQEQQRRFNERATDPLKLGKLSEIDRISQTMWQEYTDAKNLMFKHTHIKLCPWQIVKSDDKKRARLTAMQHILLKFDYPGRDLKAIGLLDPDIIYKPK